MISQEDSKNKLTFCIALIVTQIINFLCEDVGNNFFTYYLHVSNHPNAEVNCIFH